VQKSIDRLAPVREARAEMGELRARLEQLEASLAELELERTDEPQTEETSQETLVAP